MKHIDGVYIHMLVGLQNIITYNLANSGEDVLEHCRSCGFEDGKAESSLGKETNIKGQDPATTSAVGRIDHYHLFSVHLRNFHGGCNDSNCSAVEGMTDSPLDNYWKCIFERVSAE